jgi:hypothetical protein
MARGNPNIRGRPLGWTSPFKFFNIQIDPTYSVSIDNYNIILTEKCIAHKTGVPYFISAGYFATFKYVAKFLGDEVEKKDIDNYLERTKNFKISYDEGKMIVKYPNGFKFDKKENGNEVE